MALCSTKTSYAFSVKKSAPESSQVEGSIQSQDGSWRFIKKWVNGDSVVFNIASILKNWDKYQNVGYQKVHLFALSMLCCSSNSKCNKTTSPSMLQYSRPCFMDSAHLRWEDVLHQRRPMSHGTALNIGHRRRSFAMGRPPMATHCAD